MPRNTRRRTTSKPVPRASASASASASANSKTPGPQTVKVEGPGMADSVKTGMGFGLGSAVAHSTFDTIFGSNKSANGSQTQVPDQSKDMCAPLFIKYIDCVKDNDKYHPLCSEIHDFMNSYGCVKTQPSI